MAVSIPEERTYSINLQEIIEKHTWNRFMTDKGFPKKIFYRKNKFYTDIRWGYVDFTHETTRFETRPEGGRSGLPADNNVILHFSEYENKTPLSQQYTFSTSRTTTASTSVELQDSYSIGAETNIEVKFPGDILTIGAGLNGSLEVTKTEGETFEESMNWEINTEISVKAGHKLKANLCVYERTTISDFEIKTTMALLSGKLPVAIRRKSDDKIVYVLLITNLRPVFQRFAGQTLAIKQEKNEKGEVRFDVEMTTHGTCKSTSWKNQHVRVESEIMDGAIGGDSRAASPEGKDAE